MTRALRPAVAVVVVLSVLTGLAGCSLFGRTGVFSLEVGDCIDTPDLEAIEAIHVVDCGDVHGAEVYASFQLDDGDFPGTQAVTAEAEGLCLEAFEEFVGVAYNTSELYATTVTPTEDSWDRLEDREVLCLIVDPGAAATGTMRDANR